jgi:integrase
MAATPTLTDKAIRATLSKAQKDGKPLRIADGGGLLLEARPTGAGWWRLRYRHGGKEGMLSLGTYPDVSLAQARERRDDARRQLAEGTNPSDQRRADKAQAERQQEAKRRAAAGEAQEGSFEAVALDWFGVQSSKWASSYGDKVLGRLKADVFPFIGTRAVAELTPPDLLRVFEGIQARGAIETAHRARSECSQVFRFAVRKGLVLSDPCRDLAGALMTPTVRHFSAVTDPAQLAQLLRACDGYTGTPVVRAALKLAPMLFVRPGELRFASWAEFDLDTATWSIPAARMKRNKHDKLNGDPHLVPLPRQAVDVLHALQPLTEASGWVFPGERHRDKPISENTVNAALRALGFDKATVTGHGFRATARTLLAERLGQPEAVIEAQLAHSVPDALGRAYNRTQWAEMRRTMMQAWADYLDRLKQGGEVVPMPSRAA